MTNSWLESKPILNRLPYEGYQNNEVAQWLTAYWDSLLVDSKATLDDLPRQLNPLTCDEAWLDFLAVLAGYVGDFWDATWAVPIKRQLIDQAYARVWPTKGTQQLLEWLLFSLFELNGYIFTLGSFFADINASEDLVGGSSLLFYVCLDISQNREGREFKLAEKLTKLYTPAITDYVVCFDQFYADFSLAGDPVLT